MLSTAVAVVMLVSLLDTRLLLLRPAVWRLKAEARAITAGSASPVPVDGRKKVRSADVSLKADWRGDVTTPGHARPLTAPRRSDREEGPTSSASLPAQTAVSMRSLPLPLGGRAPPGTGSQSSKWTSSEDPPFSQDPPSYKGCGPEAEVPVTVVRAAQGEVEWTDSGTECQRAWVLDVQREQAVGLVLHFPLVDLRAARLLVYHGPHLVARINGSLPVSPLIIPAPRARLHVLASPSGGQRPAPHLPPPRLVFSYTAEAADTLPAPVDVDGRRRYNCSPPNLVPLPLRCDMVRQCVGGEDESDYNCTYHRSHCGPDAIHLHSICYAFVFPARPVSWFEASAQCKKHKSVIGELISAEAKQLAANLTSMNGRRDLVVGLKKSIYRPNVFKSLIRFYRFMWLWDSFAQLELNGTSNHMQNNSEDYGVLRIVPSVFFASTSYTDSSHGGYVCMNSSLDRESRFYTPSINIIQGIGDTLNPTCSSVDSDKYAIREKFHLRTCDDGSLRQSFMRCPDSRNTEEYPVRLFECSEGRLIHYTLVCDGVKDCPDDNDERPCRNRGDPTIIVITVETHAYFFCLGDIFPMSAELRCNGHFNCLDGSDEADCSECSQGLILNPKYGCLPSEYFTGELTSNTSAGDSLIQNSYARGNNNVSKVLYLDSFGSASIKFTHAGNCPETYYRCPDGTCIPAYLIRNVVYDCPFQGGTFDNEETNNISYCPGHYICRKTEVPLHPMHYCDGGIHCAGGDDEAYCLWTCPDNCMCLGQEFTCVQMFDPDEYPMVHYLDLSNVPNPPTSEIEKLPFVTFLNLSNCSLKTPTLNSLFILLVLDLSHNRLQTLNDSGLSFGYRLNYLNVSSNPLTGYLNKDSFSFLHPPGDFATDSYALKELSLSNTKVEYFAPKAFSYFRSLQRLDMRRMPLKGLVRDMFYGLDTLDTLLVSDERLCCQYNREVNRKIRRSLLTCVAQVNELSSCDDLLKTVNFRVALWLQSLMAVTGNAAVFIFRTVWQRKRAASSFRVLVTHLSLADALMGVYLSIIGAADARFRGRYLWEGDAWTASDVCRMAGFLALLSSEVSALVICLITLDGWLVFRFPFAQDLHFTPTRARLACGLAWAVGLTLAAVPLLPAFGHWRFYSQTAICLPLPITRHQFPGQDYSFAVFIALNLTLFLIIGAGQASIYLSIGGTSTAGRSDRRQQDTDVARRLLLVVATDFCCWFPVGVMGLAAARGTPIPEQVNVWAAVFLLPLNAALNPFLYMLIAALDARRRRHNEALVQYVLKSLAVHVHTWPADTVRKVLQQCQLALKPPDRPPRQYAEQSVPDTPLA